MKVERGKEKKKRGVRVAELVEDGAALEAGKEAQRGEWSRVLAFTI